MVNLVSQTADPWTSDRWSRDHQPRIRQCGGGGSGWSYTTTVVHAADKDHLQTARSSLPGTSTNRWAAATYINSWNPFSVGSATTRAQSNPVARFASPTRRTTVSTADTGGISRCPAAPVVANSWHPDVETHRSRAVLINGDGTYPAAPRSPAGTCRRKRPLSTATAVSSKSLWRSALAQTALRVWGTN